MNATLLKAMVLLAITGAILAVSITGVLRRRSNGARIQLVGAAGLVVVALTHVCEGLSLFPAMGWGRPDTVGHYIDLSSAVVGVVLTPLGFLVRRARRVPDL